MRKLSSKKSTLTGDLTGSVIHGSYRKEMVKAQWTAVTLSAGTGAYPDTSAILPDNAIVTNAWYEVTGVNFASPTSDTATLALGITSDDATGIVGAVSIATGTPWDVGLHDTVCDGVATNFTTKTTAARTLTCTVGVEAVTSNAAVLTLWTEYIVGL